MSINIIVTNKNQSTRINLYNKTNYTSLLYLINSLEKNIIKECELSVLLIDDNNGNFHKYSFDYLLSSKLLPKKWLLHNIIYSIVCDETNKDMYGKFNKILSLLNMEYYK